MYIAVNVTYPMASAITITGGSIWMQTTMPGPSAALDPNQAGTGPYGDGRLLYMGGPLIGLYYPSSAGPGVPTGAFYQAGSSPLIQGYPVLLIYRITSYNWGIPTLGQSFSDVTFTGMATVTNKRTDGSYVGASMPVDGLYVSSGCP